MKIPPYWIKEKTLINGRHICLCGSSYESMHQAGLALAQKRRLWQEYLENPALFASFTERLRAMDSRPEESEYHTTVAEPIISCPDSQNIITRNRYGALVLNSETLCFVDVDSFRDSFWRRLFGIARNPENLLLATVHKLCKADETLSARVYRTAHGWRVVLRGQGISVNSPRMLELFATLQADFLYSNLCKKQNCWRARLSPKPFHLGLPRFPFLTDSEQAPAQMADWVAAYEEKVASFGVCRLMETFGSAIIDPILELHDHYTRALAPDLKLS